jgi:predicted NAD/FAD-binding protein
MQTLAIIGTGIAGLGCAHFLHKRFELRIYEQNDYAGGHTNTITVDEAGRAVSFDTGFMVYNEVTYPNLTRLFRELDVATKPTDMSFSVQHLPTGIEYNGSSLNHLFGQRRNLLKPSFWSLLLTINRFNEEAVPALEDPRYEGMTLSQYVEERRYGKDLLERYLIPMSSAVWSTPPELMLEFPALTLLRFWHNHGFLGLHTQHPWRTVTNGARSYVPKITEPYRDRIRLNRKVASVARSEGKTKISFTDGSSETADKVILACHGDQALRLLEDPTAMEQRLLAAFQYQPNTATVHTDASVMPKTRRCWASWNYRLGAPLPGRAPQPTIHYWMNRLQGVSERQNYFVSLNADPEIDPAKVLRRIQYEHPLFNCAAVAAQKELPALNLIAPTQTTFYAGAWFKYGFHEDGFTSALDCVRAITGESPWL